MTAAQPQHFRRRHSSALPFPAHTRNALAHGSLNGKLVDPTQMSRSLASRRFSDEGSDKLRDALKCQYCGKSYKHVSSLAKHLWEHTPEWTMTKKLLISKHQQVQLLQAASILVGMNEPGSVEERDLHLSHSPFSRSLPHYTLENDDELLSMPEEQIPSSYSPMPGYVGGYIDVPSKKSHRMKTFYEEEELETEEDSEEIKSEERARQAREDEDEGILGKME